MSLTARAVRLTAMAILLAAGLSACSATVDGSGHAETPSSHGMDFPSTSAPPTDAATDVSSAPAPTATASSATPAASLNCPTITCPRAHLRFDCITDGLTLNPRNKIWPVSLYKRVEASGWAMEEGAGNWGPPGSQSERAIALQVRDTMVGNAGYGTSPTLKVDVDAAATIGAVPAHILQTTITINPAWARENGTKVTSEKLWIVVLRVSPGDDALWYASIPNLVAQLWRKVPATVRSIRVT